MAGTVLIIAGETSGDLHGSNLVREMKRRDPGLRFVGIAGPRMRAEGVEAVFRAEDLSFLGFAEVLRHLPLIRRVLRTMTRLLDELQPNLVILIDYPGFNLRFAQRARRRGIPVFYYIAPQVWAWGTSRLKKMAERIDRLAVILPFEENLLRQHGLDAHFVGHPLLELAHDDTPRELFCGRAGVNPDARLIGLFPGSRRQEVRRHLPVMLELADQIGKQLPDTRFLIAQAPDLPAEVYTGLRSTWPRGVQLLPDHHYALMNHAAALVVASGTATLEAAIFGTPFVIVYKVSPLTWLVARRLVKLPYIGLVNVVAGRRVVPELLQGDFTAENLSRTVRALLEDEALRRQMRANLLDVRRQLGRPGAAGRAAELALDLLKSGNSARNPERDVT